MRLRARRALCADSLPKAPHFRHLLPQRAERFLGLRPYRRWKDPILERPKSRLRGACPRLLSGTSASSLRCRRGKARALALRRLSGLTLRLQGQSHRMALRGFRPVLRRRRLAACRLPAGPRERRGALCAAGTWIVPWKCSPYRRKCTAAKARMPAHVTISSAHRSPQSYLLSSSSPASRGGRGRILRSSLRRAGCAVRGFGL